MAIIAIHAYGMVFLVESIKVSESSCLNGKLVCGVDFAGSEVDAAEDGASAVATLALGILKQVTKSPKLGVLLGQAESVGVIDDKLKALHGLWLYRLGQEHEEVACPSATGYAPAKLM